MKLMVIGFGRSGKDLAAEVIAGKLGLSFESSSMFCIRHFLFDRLQKEFGFNTPEEAYENRHQPGMREWLYQNISDINKDDLTRVADAIFEKHDIYVGLRSYDELAAAKEKWPDLLVIWIDSEGRTPKESSGSCTVTKDQSDIIIENRGSIDEFNDKLNRFTNSMQ